MTAQTVKANQIKPVRVAIYTRKSTTKGLENDDNSLVFQREACEDFVRSKKALGWRVIVKQYDDGGFSGANTDRPGLQQLVSDAKNGEFDVIAVYKVDRISRSVRDLVTMVEEFQALNIEFVSVSQSFDTTQPIGRLILNILASFGQFERETIAERIRDKVGAVRRKGQFVGGIPVLGYDIAPEGKRLVVNQEEAKLVREIFHMFKECQSIQALLGDLESRGARTKRWKTKTGKVCGGASINRKYLTTLLRNRLYTGKVVFKEEIYEGEHEAIVDEHLFDQVQSLLDQKRQPTRISRNQQNVLLLGLLHCVQCQVPMKYTYTSKGNKKYFYYLCTEYERFLKCKCRRKRISAMRIEQDVLGEIRALGADNELIQAMTEEARLAHEKLKADLGDKEARLKVDRKKLRSKIAYYKDRPDKASALEQAKTAMAALETELSETKRTITRTTPPFSGDDFRNAMKVFDPIWDALPFEKKKRLLDLLIDRVEYNGNEGKYGSFQILFRETGIKALGERHKEGGHAP